MFIQTSAAAFYALTRGYNKINGWHPEWVDATGKVVAQELHGFSGVSYLVSPAIYNTVIAENAETSNFIQAVFSIY